MDDYLKPKPRLSKDGSIHWTDEFYNTLISGSASLFFLFATYQLVHHAGLLGKPLHVFSFWVYGVTMTALFLASALHHGIDGSDRTNHILREIDYLAIYLAIAGGFTPFCLIVVKSTLGYWVLGIIWALALLGITFKISVPHLPKKYSTALYLAMGWMGAFIAYPIFKALHLEGVAGILVGGVFYTTGAAMFFFEKPNPVPGRFGFHEIWHLFVVAGATSHLYVMYFYVLPY